MKVVCSSVAAPRATTNSHLFIPSSYLRPNTWVARRPPARVNAAPRAEGRAGLRRALPFKFYAGAAHFPTQKWVNSSPQSSTSSFLPRLPIGYMFYLTNWAFFLTKQISLKEPYGLPRSRISYDSIDNSVKILGVI